MTYKQTIEYLFSRLPMFSRIGAAAYKEDLTNTIKLCAYLGNPQTKFKSIHIAGTNGKGSVSHMLAAILHSAGYQTGLYTSPHLKDFRERIKCSGNNILEMVNEEFVIEFTERIKPLIEEIEPSFFEITVAMAFDFFEKQKVDIAIIEVGLGGRLDSTNIITPKLSVITNIGYDHMNILGDTLEKIAMEKAGIIKKNVPVVIGETTPETKSIFKAKANEENAEIHFAAEKRNVRDWRWENHELIAEVEMQHKTDHKIFHLDLPGIYQTKNILTVLEASTVLKNMNFELTDNAIKTGLQKTKKLTGLHGRWEMIYEHPRVILDVAHNEDGIKQLVSQIELTSFHKLHIITGMVKDKNIDSILSLLPRTAHYYFTQAAIPRALGADILNEKAAQFNLKGEIYSNVNAAVKQAMFNAHKDDLIVIAGSVFLIGEVNTSIH